MKEIRNEEFGGERPLYYLQDARMEEVTVHVGESSLKHTRDIEAEKCRFEGKYVFWEADNVTCHDCYFAPSSRSSIWYSRHIQLLDCLVDAPKMFRRASHIDLQHVRMPHAQETLWDCDHIYLNDVQIAEADYLFMHSHDIRIEHYRQDGNYSFQYAKNVEIRDAVINSKDALWESENVVVYDSEINGEYLGWYAKNLRLVRCHITGEQPLCYCQNLVMEDCTMGEDADRAFEYSTVQATIRGRVTSIQLPYTGEIKADEVGETIAPCQHT